MSRHDSSEIITEDVRLKSYVTGYIFSICLTVEAYLVVVRNSFSKNLSLTIILALALIQFTAQLVYFLHLSGDKRSKWKFFVLCFMMLIVVIIVFGTLWIMSNLNYRMTPEQINNYMQSQGGF